MLAQTNHKQFSDNELISGKLPNEAKFKQSCHQKEGWPPQLWLDPKKERQSKTKTGVNWPLQVPSSRQQGEVEDAVQPLGAHRLPVPIHHSRPLTQPNRIERRGEVHYRLLDPERLPGAW